MKTLKYKNLTKKNRENYSTGNGVEESKESEPPHTRAISARQLQVEENRHLANELQRKYDEELDLNHKSVKSLQVSKNSHLARQLHDEENTASNRAIAEALSESPKRNKSFTQKNHTRKNHTRKRNSRTTSWFRWFVWPSWLTFRFFR
jgi:hypothetical protein